MALPAILIYVVFLLIPVLGGLGLSFVKILGFNFQGARFAGLSNYLSVFQQENMLLSVKNSFIFAIITTVCKVTFGLMLALALNKTIRLTKVLRTIFFFPAVINSVAVGIIFQSLMHPSRGLINVFLKSIGLDALALNWLMDPKIAIFSVCIIEIWKWSGYTIEANQYDRLATQIVFSEILHVVKNVCKKKMLDFKEILPEDLRDMLLEDDVNFEEVRKGFFNTLDAILEKQQERTQTGYSTYTARAINMMKKHYATELGLKDVAEKIRISAGYLSTTFKNDTGSSFSEYLMKIRIEKSIEMMENGEQNIRLIAEKCGFNSYEYFFSTFKKIKGETPKKFINRMALNR